MGGLDAYFERAHSPKTWSGIPLKPFYGPEDGAGRDYQRDAGDPGAYPHLRGIHADMYRGKLWTRREVCGFGTPTDTNRWLHFQLREGVSGLNAIVDVPTILGVDADHPLAEADVGVNGVHLCSLADMEALMEGIPQDEVSMSLIAASLTASTVLAQYLVLAEKRGVGPERLRGTIQNDPVHMRFCGARVAVPLNLALKMGADVIEHCVRHLPSWNPITVNLYDLREQGLNAVQELAYGLSLALLYVEEVLGRGLPIDAFAPRIAFYCSSHIDFFEEIAKLRAARRMWARLMKERYGAQDPRSLKFRFAVHTAGCSLYPQQPLVNGIRVAYEALAAVLAGAQSLHACSYDEPIALPSPQAQTLAIRTQQVLAYETGVANVADPLGGSYFVEALTDRLEAEALQLMQELEARGGLKEALETGWMDQEIERAALEEQRRMETGERRVVGVNVFRSEEPERETPGSVLRVSEEAMREYREGVRRLRQERSQAAVVRSLHNLQREAERGPQRNLLPAIMEAVRAYATHGEILGIIRQAYGYPYDPLGVLEAPCWEAA